MMLPPAPALSYTGMAIVAAFACWKLTVSPRLAARRESAVSS